ncbi:MAG: AI-2E family transporter [Planctomycetes bacterium]|nr:AI-2E family transporter [Planctomycetota bacterium]
MSDEKKSENKSNASAEAIAAILRWIREGMSSSFKYFLLVIAAIIVFWFIFTLSDIFGPLFLGLLVAYVLAPLVDWLTLKAKLPRPVAILVIFAVLIGATTWVIVEGSIRLVEEVDALILEAQEGFPDFEKKFPELSANVTKQLDEWGVNLDQIAEQAASEIQSQAKTLLGTGAEGAWTIIEAIAMGLGKMFGLLGTSLLVLLYTFFFLMGMPEISKVMMEYVPARGRETTVKIVGEINDMTRAFFRGRLVIAVIVAIIATVGLAALGVRFALFIGVITGLGIMIPFFSIICGLIPSIVILLVTGGETWQIIAVTALFFAIVFLEAFVIAPYVLGKSIEIHPLTLFVSMFCGGALMGLLGVIFAVPIVCAAKTLAREFIVPTLKELAKKEVGEVVASK